jgi:hypothetical protein
MRGTLPIPSNHISPQVTYIRAPSFREKSTGRGTPFVIFPPNCYAIFPEPRRDRSPVSPLICHPDRGGPIFSSAPNCGASDRIARFARPVRFAGVEGSRHNHRVLPPSSLFEFRPSSFAPRSPLPDRGSLISDRHALRFHFLPRPNRAITYRITTYLPNPARQCYYSYRWVEHGIS